jgi:hypothetical protein
MKFLRDYTSIANTQHFCDCCCRYIQPGEQYRGIVYVTKKHGILVTKQHENPGCDWPDPEEYSLDLSKSRNLETAVKENESLSIAA